MAHHWGYCKENGPATWTHVAPAARGMHQSPVNIATGDVVYEPGLTAKPLNIRYLPANSKELVNNGHSVQVAIDGDRSLLEGGPYAHKYQVAQFHFHWGKTSQLGAEHLVDGKAHAGELHIVHWNSELFRSCDEAIKSANGLAVLGVFIQSGDEHQGLKKLVDLLPKVQYAGEKTPIVGGFDPACLLPADRKKYWTYSGSLTTPPCYESVRFLLFKDPIQVSEQQLNAFRELSGNSRCEKYRQDENQGRLVNNFRPPLPLNDRKILSSFN